MKKWLFNENLKPKVLVITWIILVMFIAVTHFSYTKIDKIRFLGDKIKIIAIQVSQNTHLTPEDIELLYKLTYDELINHQIHQNFESKARQLMETSNIRYIYLEAPISSPFYQVSSNDTKKYPWPVDTPLDTVFLLTATRSDEDRIADDGQRPLIDKYRYTVSDPQMSRAYKKGLQGYYRAKDAWGEYITGYAPFYDTEGTLVGVMGVDLDISIYFRSLYKYFFLILLFLLTNLIMLVWIYRLVFKVRHHKVLSDTDQLTQIHNRGKIWNIMLENWFYNLNTKDHYCLIIIDVDYFKEYNDFYGHAPGDKALIKIAKALKEQADLENGWVGRFGGDEFIMVLPDISYSRIEIISSRLMAAIKNLNILHKKSPIAQIITTSIGGIVTIPNSEKTIDDIFNIADKVLYEVKKNGRNNIYLKKID